MEFHSARMKLRKLGKKNLFKMLMNQKESKCLLNGLCSFRFNYEGYSFCISEILGQGCESEKMKKLESREEEPVPEKKIEAPLFDEKRGSSYNINQKEK
jgi:maleate cis-trans isomerase